MMNTRHDCSMDHRVWRGMLLGVWLGWLASAGLAAEADRPPNFIVILADDLGYGDLGCYGSTTIATPRLDQMAVEGLRFTECYVASPFCSPSRAALLTGRLPARCGVPYVLFPCEHTGLPSSEWTMAEWLKAQGYATGCVGKWHLGWQKPLRPTAQGFDEYYGLLHTNDTEHWEVGRAFHQLSMFEPLSLRDGESVVEAPVDQSLLTEKYTQRASDFIRRHRQQPFFLFLSHTMPHIPQYASPAFQGQSRDGLYGDAIEELDASTGRILDTLRECQLAERTWVIFTSDNGAGVRGKQAQGNTAKSQPSKAQGRFPGRSFGGSNGVLRGGKGTTWEGGVRVPCIVWSPGNVGQPGEISSPICTMDFFPTFAGLNGGRLPESLQLDGVDLGELWRRGVAAESSRPIYHYFGVQLQAIRRERWKLILPIQQYPRVRVASVWFEHQPGLFERQHRLWPQPTLYDLVSDPAETVDVAGQHPEVVASLQAAAESFDTAFQQSLPPVSYLPGPMPPPPGRVRTAEDDITAWLRLVE